MISLIKRKIVLSCLSVDWMHIYRCIYIIGVREGKCVEIRLKFMIIDKKWTQTL